jgi:hypothetical protein
MAGWIVPTPVRIRPEKSPSWEVGVGQYRSCVTAKGLVIPIPIDKGCRHILVNTWRLLVSDANTDGSLTRFRGPQPPAQQPNIAALQIQEPGSIGFGCLGLVREC